MPQTPYDGGGGGGSTTTTDTGICSITPSDLVGYTGNALNRIKDLEQRVAELEAKITQANQLSDLAQQVGWVGGLTYLGVSGWTQTEYGTMIPPPGVTLSSLGITIPNVGSALQFMVMDENGNLVLGIDELGQLLGTAGGGMVPDFALKYASSSGSGEFLHGITIASSSISTNSVSLVFQVSRAGLYEIKAEGAWGCTIVTGGGLELTSDISIGTGSAGAGITNRGNASIGNAGSYFNGSIAVNPNPNGISNSSIFPMEAGWYARGNVTATAISGATITGRESYNISITYRGANT